MVHFSIYQGSKRVPFFDPQPCRPAISHLRVPRISLDLNIAVWGHFGSIFFLLGWVMFRWDTVILLTGRNSPQNEGGSPDFPESFGGKENSRPASSFGADFLLEPPNGDQCLALE